MRPGRFGFSILEGSLYHWTPARLPGEPIQPGCWIGRRLCPGLYPDEIIEFMFCSPLRWVVFAAIVSISSVMGDLFFG